MPAKAGREAFENSPGLPSLLEGEDLRPDRC